MQTHKTQIATPDWLQWLAERRDGFLVGGAVLYGLGYLVWSYNAWQNHLGQLPALQFQYIMAGLIPGAIIAIAWAATSFFAKMQDRMIILFEKHSSLHSVFFIIVHLSSMVFLIGLIVTYNRWLDKGWSKSQLNMYIVPLFAICVYIMLLMTGVTYQNKRVDRMLRLYKYAVAFLFCWYSLLLYFNLYPSLPQELGGPQPRCAYVDLVREDIAPSSLSVLLPNRTVVTGTTPQEFDLRLMSVGTTDDLVYNGRSLLLVALVGGTNLHIRIFNAGGKVIFDKAVKDLENEEETKAELADLKKRLSPFPDESHLSKREKEEIVNSVTSIAGLNPHKEKVVRSKKLNVYFSSSDYLLVRVADDTENHSNSQLKNAPLYELRKEVIRVVQWCPK